MEKNWKLVARMSFGRYSGGCPAECPDLAEALELANSAMSVQHASSLEGVAD